MKLNFREAVKRLIIFLIIPLFYSGCDDLVYYAIQKGDVLTNKPFDLSPTNFKAVEGSDNREVVLTWSNPVADNFSSVRLIRKTGSEPKNDSDDNSETVLYEGTYEKYIDSGLKPDNTYYYAIYGKSTSNIFSKPNYAVKAVTETVLQIRQRSFFIIGGSGDKVDPTSDLIAGVDMFDPVTETLYPSITTLPTPRVFGDATSAGNKIYYFGGFNGSGVSDVVDILDITDLSWTSGTAMTAAKCAHRALAWRGKIYILGGSTTIGAGGVSTANALNTYIYDTENDSWSQDDTVFCDILTANGKGNFSAVQYNGLICYYGGVRDTGAWENNGRVHNIMTNIETGLGGLSYYIGSTSALWEKDFNDGSTLAIFFTIGGSSTTTQTLFPATTLALSTNYVYATILSNYSPYGYMIAPLEGPNKQIEGFTNRAYAGAASYGDYIYLFGGIAADNQASSIIERLDVEDGDLRNAEWTALSNNLVTSRYGFGITKTDH